MAYAFKWPPRELDALPLDELLVWHGQIERIGKALKDASK